MIQRLKNSLKPLLDIDDTELLLSRKLGIPLKEIKRLKQKEESDRCSALFGKPIQITNNFWHLHSLKEIFLDEVYKFSSESVNPIIIDCGANIGLSIIYFNQIFPLSKIIAFEADQQIYGKLETNLSSFNILNAVTHNKAIWTEDAILNFNAKGNLGGTIDLEFSEVTVAGGSFTKVHSTRLKPYLTDRVDFLKIDIEGAEFEVLNDCAENLTNVSKIFVEYHSSPSKKQNLSALIKILEQAGFRIYIKEAWNNLPYPFLFNNYKPFWDLQLNIFGYRI